MTLSEPVCTKPAHTAAWRLIAEGAISMAPWTCAACHPPAAGLDMTRCQAPAARRWIWYVPRRGGNAFTCRACHQVDYWPRVGESDRYTPDLCGECWSRAFWSPATRTRVAVVSGFMEPRTKAQAARYREERLVEIQAEIDRGELAVRRITRADLDRLERARRRRRVSPP